MSKTAVVTGATGGIGEAVVDELLAGGYRVLALGRSPEKLERLRARLPGVETVAADLGELEGRIAALDGIDRLEALVHCAGVADVASVEETDRALWDTTLAANVTGPAVLTRPLFPPCARAGVASSS